MVTTDNLERTHVLRASCVNDMLNLRPHPNNANHDWLEVRHARHNQSFDWLGIHGGTPAVERAVRQGWPEGRAKAQRNIEALELPRVKSIKRQRTQAEAGDHLDMQRVYAGDLDRAWETTRRDLGISFKSPLVSLLVNVGGSSNVKAEEMFWRGAAALVACDALEQSGRRVEILAYNYAGDVYPGAPYPDGLTVVKAKAHEGAVNLDQLASVIALAGFFRTYIFMAKLVCDQRASPGFGRTIHTAPSAALLGVAEGSEMLHVTNVWDRNSANGFMAGLAGTVLT